MSAPSAEELGRNRADSKTWREERSAVSPCAPEPGLVADLLAAPSPVVSTVIGLALLAGEEKRGRAVAQSHGRDDGHDNRGVYREIVTNVLIPCHALPHQPTDTIR